MNRHSASPRMRAATAAVDVILGLCFASLLGEFVAAAYYPSLRALAPHPSALVLGALLLPALAACACVRRVAAAGLVAVAALLAASLRSGPQLRAVLLAAAWVGVAIAILAAARVRPQEVGRRTAVGLWWACWLRAMNDSYDPVHAWWLPVVAMACSLVVAGWVGHRNVASPAELQPRSGVLPGVAFGAALFLVHGWVLGPTVVPRWAGCEPTWSAGVLIASAFGFALRPPALLPVLGIAWLATASGTAAVLGGLLFVWAVPGFWSSCLAGVAVGGARAAFAGFAIYAALLAIQGGAFAVDYTGGLPWSVYPTVVAVLALGAAALATWPGPRRQSAGRTSLGLAAMMVMAVAATSGGARAVPVAPEAVVAMTWNIQQGFDCSGSVNLDRVRAAVQLHGVTVLALQETDATRPTSPGRDPVAWLAPRLGMHVVNGPDPREPSFGLALFSAHPVVESRQLLLPSGPGRVALLLATLDVAGRHLQVAVPHLSGPDDRRLTQVAAIAAALRERQGPLLLLGDFNAVADSAALERLRAEGFGLAAGTAAGIDHLMGRDLVVEPARVLATGPISDHEPVVARVRLP